MRKYLIRGGYNPLKPPTLDEILFEDLIGTNSGNVLYLMGVLRSIWASDVDIDVDNYKYEQGKYNDSDVDRINGSYDAYLIPLADAFRDSFANGLNRLSKFVAKLKIPVHIISVGMRANYEPEFVNNPLLDDAVKRFMNTVLDHSPVVGIRGEITGEYLHKLGFIQEKHYTVIGCPSLFIFGNQLVRRETDFNKYSGLSLCFRPGLVDINDDLLRVAQATDDWHVVVQNLNELKCIHLGMGNHSKPRRFFYADINDPLIIQKRIKGFVSAGDWIRYMREKDFSIGGLFHGSVAGFLGGATTVVIPSDARMRELCEYHSLPAIPEKEWIKVLNVNEILNKVELDSHLAVHNSNFVRYRSFLERIGIQSVWDKNEKPKADLLRFSRPIENCLSKEAKEITSLWVNYFDVSSKYQTDTDKIHYDKEKIVYKKTTDRIPVFTWHRIVNDNIKNRYLANDEWAVSVSELEEQLEYLFENGYRTIFLDELDKWYSGEIELDNKTVVLAFDDGYVELFYLVWPLLQKYGFCATSFVIGDRIKYDDYRWVEEKQSFITYNMFNILNNSDSCIDFQSHTWGLHEKVSGKSKVFSCSLDNIQKDFENMTKFSNFKFIAYPYGAYNEELLKQVKANGYKLGFVFGNIKNNDFVTKDYNRFLLPRIKMSAESGVNGLTKWLDLL